MKTKVIIATTGIFLTEVIWQLYKAYKRSQRKTVKVSDGCTKYSCRDTEDRAKIFEVMFFSKDSALCRPHLNSQEFCTKTNCAVKYFRRIIHYLDSATGTLDICMYFLTSSILAKAIINAHKRGVTVKIILDESMTQNDYSQTTMFYKEGIKLKYKQLYSAMHHKFVIIDNNIVITGSTNWTMTAFFGNFENLMVTNESELVKPFINEFEKIWTMFDATEKILN